MQGVDSPHGDDMAAQLTIGELARNVGVNVQTVRYYERVNLLGPSARKPSGYRLYGREEERRLRFIKNAQVLGFTLREIAELLALRVVSSACRGDMQKRAQAKQAQVESKVDNLQALARALKSLIRACKIGQSTDHCPILISLEKETKSCAKNGATKR